MRQLGRISLAGLMLAAVAACGGGSDSTTDPTPPNNPPPVEPANITIVDAQQSRGHDFGNEVVTVHLKNTGGPGAFTIEAWGLPHTPNGDDSYFGRTEAVEVAAGYDETVSWEFVTGEPPDFFYINWLLIQSRDQGSAQYRQTGRFDFPIP